MVNVVTNVCLFLIDIPFQEFEQKMKDFLQKLNAEKEIEVAKLRKKAAVADRDSTPPMYNEAEADVIALFPINIYTEAIDWLLKQRVVQNLIYFDVMRVVYRNHPVFKPEAEIVTSHYMDYIMSTRLMTHLAKSTTKNRKLDFSRVPCPAVFVDIVDNNMVDLGKRRVPGAKDNSAFMQHRCNSVRRTHLLNSDYVKSSPSMQQMAHSILAERVDFVAKNEVRSHID